jgi:hypothetical protein
MLQRQIVVNSLGRQIGIDDLAYTKYAGMSFHSIVWILIFDIVTINRNVSLVQRYEISQYIISTKLRSCI